MSPKRFFFKYSFLLRDLKFGICIKDPIKKHAEKIVKICQTGLLKLNFEIIPKKRIFWFKFPQAMDEVEIFFANFQILGPQNVKKVKITAPYCTSHVMPVQVYPFPPPAV
jgi:hypothetical protein